MIRSVAFRDRDESESLRSKSPIKDPQFLLRALIKRKLVQNVIEVHPLGRHRPLLKGHKEWFEKGTAGTQPLGTKHDPPLQRKDHTAGGLMDQPSFEE